MENLLTAMTGADVPPVAPYAGKVPGSRGVFFWRVIGAFFLTSLVFLVLFYVLRKPAVTAAMGPPNPPPPPETPAALGVKLDPGNGQTISVDSVPIGNIAYEDAQIIVWRIELNAIRCERRLGVIYNNGVDREGKWVWHRLTTGLKRAPFLVQLPDSVMVCLNGGSYFSYPEAGRESGAHCYLKGEGYFEVPRDPGRPFFIDTWPEGTVEVLGTNFCIEAKEDENTANPQVHVWLLSGALQVETRTERMRLLPQEQAVSDSSGRITRRQRIDTLQVIRWARKTVNFQFRNTEFNKALRQVAAWNGDTIINRDGLSGEPIDGEVPRTSPERVIKAIQTSQKRKKVLVTRRGHQIIVSPNSKSD